MDDLRITLEEFKKGNINEDEVILRLKKKPFVDIGYASFDSHRSILQGNTEVIYGAGKTAEQIIGIVRTMLLNDEKHILITRLDDEKAKALVNESYLCDVTKYYPEARLAVVGGFKPCDTEGYIAVVTAGTSDIPVAEEAAITAEFLGNKVERIYDVGVAGLHRLLSHLDKIMAADVIIAIAGMEGALASVVGGLASCPVIAVPTSVGYGASFEGLSALLSMLNSCASGVSVVNIDNGFGAAYQAGMINHKRG